MILLVTLKPDAREIIILHVKNLLQTPTLCLLITGHT